MTKISFNKLLKDRLKNKIGENKMADICKEYYKLDRNKPTIGLLMMLKNEQKRLQITLDSVVGFVDALIIYDTGSTDNTINIVEKFSEKHKINLYLKKGDFVDFSTSRNISLDLADTIDVHYILLLDCNDELRGGEYLREAAREFINKQNTAFLVCQEWFTGQKDKYFNIRFVKPRNSWRYQGSVHEWFKDMSSPTDQPRFPVVRLDDSIVIYQDRVKDDDKSAKRFKLDRELLLRDHKKNPTDPRTLFYLAQTCQCLGEHSETLYYSKLRLEQEGFLEEKFHSYMRCGVSCINLGHEWYDAMVWFLKAYENFQRAEPLVKIAEYYRLKAEMETKENKNAYNTWRTAFFYINEACRLTYPEHCILFVDKSIYDYQRWHVMGIVGYYAGEYEKGKQGCLKAMAQGINIELDKKNLQFYLDKEKSSPQIYEQGGKISHEKDKVPITREKFLLYKMNELKSQFPDMPRNKLIKKAKEMWKKN
jgi:glycosyltransferase involved in cell wall biosynthesis